MNSNINEFLYSIDCKFSQFCYPIEEPDQGYYIRQQLLKEIREFEFELVFENEDVSTQTSGRTDAVFFEEFSRQIQSKYKIFVKECYCDYICKCMDNLQSNLMNEIVRYAIPCYRSCGPVGPSKEVVDEKILSVFIKRTEDIYAEALDEKRQLFNRFVIVFNSTSTKRCRRDNRAYAKAERDLRRQCIEDARAELLRHMDYVEKGLENLKSQSERRCPSESRSHLFTKYESN